MKSYANLKSKRILLTIIILIIGISSIYALNNIKAQVNYVIDGDTVYIDIVGKANISVTPLSLKSDINSIEVNVTSYFAGSQDLDFAIGINLSNKNTPVPKNAWLFNPKMVNDTKSYTCNTWFNYTINPNHFWCWLNKTSGNETIDDVTLLFERDFEWGDLGAATAYWNESRRQQYQSITNKFSKINYSYGDMDTWYVIKGATFDQDETKSLRIQIDVPVQFGLNSGKYDLCIKPSSLSINEAIAQDKLGCLDPWFDIDWPYKQEINITVSTGTTADNFSVRFFFNASNIGSNFNWTLNGSDIRIVNGSENLLLPYWIENFSYFDEYATIWSKADQNISTVNGSVYMLYGNKNSNNLSVINETFLYGDDFDDGVYTDKWTVLSPSGGSITESGGTLQVTGNGFDGLTAITKETFNASRFDSGFVILSLRNTIQGWDDLSGVQSIDNNNNSLVIQYGCAEDASGCGSDSYFKTTSGGTDFTGQSNTTFVNSDLPGIGSGNWYYIRGYTVLPRDWWGGWGNYSNGVFSWGSDAFPRNVTVSTDLDVVNYSLQVNCRNNANCDFDWMFARKAHLDTDGITLIEPEAIFGAEETLIRWSQNQTNSTVAASDTLFSVYWEGSGGLDGYIFGWHNGTNWTLTNTSLDVETSEQTFEGAQ